MENFGIEHVVIAISFLIIGLFCLALLAIPVLIIMVEITRNRTKKSFDRIDKTISNIKKNREDFNDCETQEDYEKFFKERGI